MWVTHHVTSNETALHVLQRVKVLCLSTRNETLLYLKNEVFSNWTCVFFLTNRILQWCYVFQKIRYNEQIKGSCFLQDGWCRCRKWRITRELNVVCTVTKMKTHFIVCTCLQKRLLYNAVSLAAKRKHKKIEPMMESLGQTQLRKTLIGSLSKWHLRWLALLCGVVSTIADHVTVEDLRNKGRVWAHGHRGCGEEGTLMLRNVGNCSPTATA
jgi:hypothetical protein